MRRIVILAALLLATGAQAATVGPPDGAKLFRQRCALCHAEGGFGANMLGRHRGSDKAVLERRADLTPDVVRLAVRRGTGSMPPFSRIELTEPELQAIASYLTRK